MPGGAEITTKVLTETLFELSSVMEDNISKMIPLFWFLRARGQVIEVDGGYDFRERLMYGKGSFGYYARFGTLDTTPQEGMTMAIYSQKRCAGSIVVEEWDVLQNKGRHAIGQLVKDTQLQTEITMAEELGIDLFNDGSDSLRIHGLQYLVADAPTTGTVGDIDRSDSTNSWWRNNIYTTALTTFEATWLTGWHVFQRLYIAASKRANDGPNFIVTTDDIYRFYTAGPADRLRFQGGTPAQMAEAGMAVAGFHGAAVTFDANCPASHAYFLNTKYLRMKALRGANFVMKPSKSPANQPWLDIGALVLIAQLTMSNAVKQAVATNITG